MLLLLPCCCSCYYLIIQHCTFRLTSLQYSATSDEATFPPEPLSPQYQYNNNNNNVPNYYTNNNANNNVNSYGNNTGNYGGNAGNYGNSNANCGNSNGNYGNGTYRDGQYDMRYERQGAGRGRDEWVPYKGGDNRAPPGPGMQYNNAPYNGNNLPYNGNNPGNMGNVKNMNKVLSSSSKTYTTPDGTVVTEVLCFSGLWMLPNGIRCRCFLRLLVYYI